MEYFLSRKKDGNTNKHNDMFVNMHHCYKGLLNVMFQLFYVLKRSTINIQEHIEKKKHNGMGLKSFVNI